MAMVTPKRRRVLAEHEAGASVQELAQDYGVTPQAVRGWLLEVRQERADREEHLLLTTWRS